jgi:hypothetical protein
MENKKIGFPEQRPFYRGSTGWFLFETDFSWLVPVCFGKIYQG